MRVLGIKVNFYKTRLLYIVRGGNKFEETGQVTFRTRTSVGKQDLKDYLRGVYGLVATHISTINYDGKIKRKLPGGQRFVGFSAAQHAKLTLDIKSHHIRKLL